MAGLTDEKKAAVVAAFESGATWKDAAKVAGVSERTIYRYVAADPELFEAVAVAKDQADDLVEFVTYRNCLNPDPAHNVLRMFWLKARRSAVYNAPAVHQHTFTAIDVDLSDPEDPPPPPDGAPA